jgi:SulP family sulfate permease
MRYVRLQSEFGNMTANSTGSKAKVLLKSYIPILDWLPNYDKQWLRPDLIAAVTIWALLVPEAMAYATLAGVPPEAGLYAAPLALLGYAIFGTSRQLVVGPSSTIAVMSAVVVSTFAVRETEEYIALTAALAIVVGVLFIVAGLLKLGFLADFMSRPVLSGLVVGIAITIVMGQFDKILGYEIAESSGFIEELFLLIRGLGSIHWLTVLIAASSLALLFILGLKFPKVPAALTVVILGIVVSALLDLNSYGVHIVGDIPAGLPPLGFPDLRLGDFLALIPGAIGIMLVAFAESTAAARTYAKKHGYEIRASQEMVGLGVANFGAGFSQGFAVDGSLSRTAGADQNGQKTQLSSIIKAALVLLTALFLTPIFRTLPEAVLGAIVIHAVWHLISFKELRRLYHIRRLDFWAGLVALVGVLMFGILSGLLLAVFLSFLALLARASDPDYAILGNIPDQGREVFGNIEVHPDAHTYPGLIIFRFDQQLFFANAPKFRAHIHEEIDASVSPVRVVLIDAEDIPDIDSSALDMLIELREELIVRGIDLWFARVKKNVEEYLRLAAVYQEIDDSSIFMSVRAGVDAFQDQKNTMDQDNQTRDD